MSPVGDIVLHMSQSPPLSLFLLSPAPTPYHQLSLNTCPLLLALSHLTQPMLQAFSLPIPYYVPSPTLTFSSVVPGPHHHPSVAASLQDDPSPASTYHCQPSPVYTPHYLSSPASALTCPYPSLPALTCPYSSLAALSYPRPSPSSTFLLSVRYLPNSLFICYLYITTQHPRTCMP